ncbi:MAG: hypothetical protein DI535_16825 [Citrobacter freundii]|nr:MAG: hypothetical protein DI535_16825 [Citrobacter freundii]
MKRTWALFAGLMILLSSCHYFEGKRVKGDGNVTTNTHPITDFKGVDVSGAIDLYLIQGDTYAVKVVTDQNLQQYIEVRKDGSVLRVHPTNNTNLDATGKVKVYVTAPSFVSIEVSGASTVTSETKLTSQAKIDVDLTGASNADLDLNAPNIEIEASGASEASVKGETKNLSVNGSGSSSINAFELLSETADIDISGASDVSVYASVKINGQTSGASTIRYKGNAQANIDKSGAGSVKKED